MEAKSEDGELSNASFGGNRIGMAHANIDRRFSGEESFSTTPALDAGSGLGVVIEGKKSGGSSEPSRL